MTTLIPIRGILPLALATAALVSAPALAAKGSTAEIITWNMTPTAADLNAKGMIQFKSLPGKEQFNLTVHRLAAGTYDFTLDGAVVATFQVGSGAKGNGATGKLRLKAKHGSLGFDPHGADLTVSRAGVDFLVASFPDCDDEADDEVKLEAAFVATGVIPGAAGDAEFKSEEGETEFEIDVNNLPAGTYDVLVGGVAVGSILVDSTGAGEVEFTTDVDDRDEDGISDDDPLLTFDPLGQLIQVSQNGVAILDVTFPTAPSSQVCDDDDDDDDDEGENED